MKLVEKYGFILQAFGSTATLATHRNQIEDFNEAGYLSIQKMNGHCPKDFGYPGCLTEDGDVMDCGDCMYVKRKRLDET